MKAKLRILLVIPFLIGIMFAQTGTIKHTVEPGQTLYFISKKYNLSVAELRASNPTILDDLIIKPGQELLIPVKNVPVKVDLGEYKMHTVQTKETLFSISKLYGVSVDQLIQLNNLESPSIKIGQELKIKKLNVNQDAIFNNTASNPPIPANTSSVKPTEAVKPVETKKTDTPKAPTNENVVIKSENVSLYKQLFESYNNGTNTLNKDKGIGNYLDGNSTGAYLAMVNNVPAGQIVKVRNLMNNKVIYLKVVGPVSSKDVSNNINIKISKSAALDLNIIEDRFLAEWQWYTLKSGSTQQSNSSTFDDF